MKNARIITLSVFTLAIAFLMSFTIPEKETIATPEGDKFEIPSNIQDIFDKSCFGCHNTDTQNDKGKKKLMIDKLANLSKAKLVGKLDGIVEAVKENEMPPEKFLEKFPENKLTKEEAKKLMDWANNSAEELMK